MSHHLDTPLAWQNGQFHIDELYVRIPWRSPHRARDGRQLHYHRTRHLAWLPSRGPLRVQGPPRRSRLRDPHLPGVVRPAGRPGTPGAATAGQVRPRGSTRRTSSRTSPMPIRVCDSAGSCRKSRRNAALGDDRIADGARMRVPELRAECLQLLCRVQDGRCPGPGRPRHRAAWPSPGRTWRAGNLGPGRAGQGKRRLPGDGR
jgi:hypothetical protein